MLDWFEMLSWWEKAVVIAIWLGIYGWAASLQEKINHLESIVDDLESRLSDIEDPLIPYE